jgi:hypothetical protein
MTSQAITGLVTTMGNLRRVPREPGPRRGGDVGFHVYRTRFCRHFSHTWLDRAGRKANPLSTPA